ncbi:MAG: DNA mismatch repair protein MutL, partial [Acidobacteriota bacterium]
YVNGRPVLDRVLLAAVREAYKGRLLAREYPQAVIFMEIEPQDLDVNVHPAKTEVRFREEQAVFLHLRRAVGAALDKAMVLRAVPAPTPWVKADGEPPKFASRRDFLDELVRADAPAPHETTPSAAAAPDFSSSPRTSFSETLPPLPGAEQPPSRVAEAPAPEARPPMGMTSGTALRGASAAGLARAGLPPAGRAFPGPTEQGPTPTGQTRHFDPPAVARRAAADAAGLAPGQGADVLRARTPDELEPALPPGMRYLGQFDDTYLIVDFGRELVLVDQHAAHERVIYAAMEATGSRGHSRPLGMPVEIRLHPSEQARLQTLFSELRAMGFQVDTPRPGLAAIAGAPPGLTVGQAKEYLSAALSGQSKSLQDLWVLMSCKTAIKAGTRLTDDEAVALLAQWAKAPERDYCPHGRPVTVRFGQREMEKMFKRRK